MGDQQNASGRRGHLVGSIPADNAEAAMMVVIDTLAERLHWVPDGETGERRNWVMHIVEGLRSHPDLEVKRAGDWSDYSRTLTFRVRRGHILPASSLDFGHVADFRLGFEAFQSLKTRTGRHDLVYQVGIPGDFDMAGLVLGPIGAMRHRRAFHEATVAEIAEIYAVAGREVVFQIEVPFELVLVTRAPKPVRPLLAKWLGSRVSALARHSPPGARFGVHLCLGDMNHKAIIEMRDLSPVVALANAVSASWPKARELAFIHAPFSGASHPPPGNAAFYTPLAHLKIPSTTRFIAGMAHVGQPLADQRRLLELVERLAGRQVDLSAACGLGRLSREDAGESMQRIYDLAST